MSRVVDLLPLLSMLKPAALSGERLAQGLRMTRTAVWKQIRTLKSLGFPIRTVPRLGYALDATPDFSLAGLTFHGALKHWAKPHYELSTPSTQELASHAAQKGIPEGHFWLAEIQTQGRGRLERPWSSGFGGLWFSLVLRPQVPPSRAASIGLVAALTWARVIEKKAKIKARLKWPNDILFKDANGAYKKIAGFLTQMSGEIDKTDWMVLGMGINVFNSLPKELKDKAAAISGPPTFSRAELITEFFRRFYPAYRQWQRQGFAIFQADYWAHYAHRNEPCTLKTVHGTLRGIARHIDPTGALLLESRGKTHSIFEGEIIL